jgi:hypothetical protein
MPESRRLLTADRYNGFTAYDLRKPGRELQILQCSLPACLSAGRYDTSLFWVSHEAENQRALWCKLAADTCLRQAALVCCTQ